MSYTKKAKNKYKIDVEITVDGERFRKSKRITTSLKGTELKGLMNSEENKLLAELKIKAQDISSLSNMTFSEFGKFHTKERKLEAKTIDWYEDYLGGIVEKTIGHKKINKITVKDIELLFEKIKATKSKHTGRCYSPKTVKHYHTAVHAVFTTAVKKRIIKANPAAEVKLDPVKRTLNNNFLGPTLIEEYAEKLRELGDPELELYFIFSVTCGVRPSELFALKWKKIDFNKSAVLINKALVLTKGGYVYKSTKTEDERALVLTNYLLILFKQHKENEIRKHRKLGVYTNIEEMYVFTNEKGEHLKETTQRDKWRDFCKKNELKYVTPYGLRHSCATLLAYNRIPMVNIAHQLGHVNTSTTDIYVHAAEEINEEVKSIMEGAMAPKLKLVK